NDMHLIALVKAAELQLEIDQADADAGEEAKQEIIDAQRLVDDIIKLQRIGPAEGGDMLFRHHRVVQLVRFVVIFDDRAGQGRALSKTEPLADEAVHNLTDHHLALNDFNLADQLLAHIEAADEMVVNTDFR